MGKHPAGRLPLSAAVAFVLGGLGALVGLYWDDSWHTDRGRDTFWSAPHLVLYGGVAVVAIAVALWARRVYRNEGDGSAVLRSPGVLLASLGVAVTFAAAPLDDAWHRLFGRDAVLWSPPHLVAVVALFAVAAGFVLASARWSGGTGAAVQIAAAALLLGAAHVPVMEYESDVPQFATAWYLPVLAIGATLAFSLARGATGRRWIATEAAAAYTVVRLGVLTFQAALDHSPALVTPILVPALASDLMARRNASRPWRALLVAVAFYGSYVPHVNLSQLGPRLDAAAVLPGLPIAALGGWLALAAADERRPGVGPRVPRLRSATLLVLLLLVASAPAAAAHDPGQGTEVGRVHLVATSDGLEAEVRAHVLEPEACVELSPVRLVARRAGETLAAPLRKTSACRLDGRIGLPEPGRWFVYLELKDGSGRPLEAWLPVLAGTDRETSQRVTPLYRPNTRPTSWAKVLAGGFLYLVAGGLLAATLVAFRRRGRIDAGLDPPTTSGS